MGWFFGCFGGGKKERRHGSAAAPLAKQKRPSQPLPTGAPPKSAPVPINLSPFKQGVCRNDLTTLSNSAPVTRAEGIISHQRTPEKVKKQFPAGDPWSQLDELEEELKDLSNQITRESEETRKVKEEVNLLKSCGTVFENPSACKKSVKPLERQSNGEPGKSWHSWLPSYSTLPLKLQGLHENKDWQAASCKLVPAKEGLTTLQNVQIPGVYRNTMGMDRDTNLPQPVHSSFQASIGNSIVCPQDNSRKDNILHRFQNERKASTSATQKMGQVVNFQTLEATKNKSPDSQDLFDISSIALKQPDSSLHGDTKLGSALDKNLVDTLPKKKRRLAGGMSPQKTLDIAVAEAKPEENSSSQKRLKVLTLADSAEHTASSPKSGLLSEEFSNDCSNTISASMSEKTKPTRHRYQASVSTISASRSSYESGSTYPCGDSGTTGRRYTEGSYSSNLLASNDSYSSSDDSDKTVSDLSPEQCYSPPLSPSRQTGDTRYSAANSWAGEAASHYESQASSCYSLINGGCKNNVSSRYACETREITKSDEHELFSDAMSYMSTERSEGQAINSRGSDGITAQLTQLGFDTRGPHRHLESPAGQQSRTRSKLPPSLVLTPVENVSQWKQLKERHHNLKERTTGRNKHTEQVSKERRRDENKDAGSLPSHRIHRREDGDYCAMQFHTDASLSHWSPGSLQTLGKGAGEVEAPSFRTDATLSQWNPGALYAQQSKAISPSEAGEVRVDTSLSVWLDPMAKEGTSSSLRSKTFGSRQATVLPAQAHGLVNESFWRDVNKSMMTRRMA